MRFLLLALSLVACSTDTFVGDDAGIDASPPDGVAPSDGSKVDAPVFDPSMLGTSLVLWLDAADAKSADGGDLVALWPDHQNKYATIIDPGAISTNGCFTGLHVSKVGTINNKPAVTFCSALFEVNDAPGLHLGVAPFVIQAVISPAQPSGTNEVFFTKTPQADQASIPSDLTLVAPLANGSMQGQVNANATAVSQGNIDHNFQYVAFVRTSSTIQVRVNGQPGTAVPINSSDDASFNGAAIQIGGYRFDAGNFHNLFHGAVAEVLVISDPGRIGDVELYFKKKYAL